MENENADFSKLSIREMMLLMNNDIKYIKRVQAENQRALNKINLERASEKGQMKVIAVIWGFVSGLVTAVVTALVTVTKN